MSDDTSNARSDAGARIKAILTSPEAQGRSNLAEYLAFETDMEPESALAILSHSDKAEASDDMVSSYEKRRLAAMEGAVREVSPLSGLARPSGQSSVSTSGGLVANMKRRHGIT